jgi:predicted ribosome quality control (RQC) complex YloA/Tae2 family protein
MALNSAEVSRVLDEIAPAILGGSVQKIFQPAQDAITLEIHKQHRTVLLLLSADPDTARIHLLRSRPANPPAPPDFCQFLRAHLEGGRLVGVEQWRGDRIVRLTIAGHDGPLLLVAELTGRGANLLVLNAEEKILRALHTRPLHPPPPDAPGRAPSRSHPPALGPPKRALSPLAQARSSAARSGHPLPSIATGHMSGVQVDPPLPTHTRPPQARRDAPLPEERYAVPLGGPWIATVHSHAETGPATQGFPISEEMERRYEQQETEREQATLQRVRLGKLRKALKKTTRRLESLTGDLDKAARYRDYARYGELLKTRLSDIAKGQDRIAVVDYFDPALPELVLPLNPAKDANGNMQDYFRKYRKHLAAEREIRPRLEATEQELKVLRLELEALEHSEWPPATSSGAEPTRSRRLLAASGTNRKESKSGGPFRRFTSADGLPIFVGRNARENEQLTFGLARSHDLWFHARGVPGSHVLLRVEKGVAPPAASIRDAGTLALLYSGLKKSGKGEVMYAKRSDVRKIKGKTPGTVTVTQDKTVFADLDPTRLRRLKESQGIPDEKTMPAR